MSFEVISAVKNAEEQAESIISGAKADAKQMLADVKNQGETAIAAAVARAESELVELRKKSEEKAESNSGQILGNSENKKAVIRAKAEARLEAAADIIVERIVNG